MKKPLYQVILTDSGHPTKNRKTRKALKVDPILKFDSGLLAQFQSRVWARWWLGYIKFSSMQCVEYSNNSVSVLHPVVLIQCYCCLHGAEPALHCSSFAQYMILVLPPSDCVYFVNSCAFLYANKKMHY